jgi:hypothetical protein
LPISRKRLKADTGLHPKGHPDCPWGEHYPFQYFTALDFLETDANDEERAFATLVRLLHKIEAEAARGTPLQANGREWREGSYPPEYEAARTYVREQMGKQECELVAT